jgi:hypothetical protein
MDWRRSWTVLLGLAVVAFMAFLARAFIDWRFVYVEFLSADDQAGTLAFLVAYLALAAAWLWALGAVAQRRRAGAAGVLALSLVLLVGIGIATPTAFCPAPCPTEWAWGWELNWAGLVTGLLAAAAALARLTARD